MGTVIIRRDDKRIYGEDRMDDEGADTEQEAWEEEVYQSQQCTWIEED